MRDERFDLEISRVMKAPRAKVWRAFADPAHLARWWCPQPWVTEVKAFELRPGGAFHTHMTGPLPDGTQGVSDNPGVLPRDRAVGAHRRHLDAARRLAPGDPVARHDVGVHLL
jgi:hypothetical protein